jgi:hypothetical protein
MNIDEEFIVGINNMRDVFPEFLVCLEARSSSVRINMIRKYGDYL